MRIFQRFIAIVLLFFAFLGHACAQNDEKPETLDGLLEYLESRFSPEARKSVISVRNQNDPTAIMREDGDGMPVFFDHLFYGLASSIVSFNDPKAIPYLIGAIDADNSYATVYGLGWSGLSKLTGVEYSVFHDGAFWRRWWEKNKTNFPEEVQKIPIPDLPKTPYGKTYVPFPVETETLQGQLLFFQAHAKRVKGTRWEDPIGHRPPLSQVATSISAFNDPTAIPFLISIIDLDTGRTENLGNGRDDMGYITGYWGLGYGHHPLTDVRYEESHDGTWWKQWWEENKKNYPAAVQNIPIPSIHDEWNIPDLSREIALWHQEEAEAELQAQEAQRREREEQMFKELAESDVGDVPAERLHVEGNEKMGYFLIGVDPEKAAPPSGYHLVVVMPGGNGDAGFHPFVRRIWKYAMDESNFIIAQPVAVHWTANQQIVWPTENVKVEQQEFSTELFVESVVADVGKRVKIDPGYVFTLSWSSSGPAAYAAALQEKTAITGSYIVMSVFKPDQLPPLENAKGRLFAIQHSPNDRVCPFVMAKDAEKRLTEHGAKVQFMEYPEGHGWSGNVYGRIRQNLDWLKERQ